MTEQTRTRTTPSTAERSAQQLVPAQRSGRRHVVADARVLERPGPFVAAVRWRKPVAWYGAVLGVTGGSAYVLAASGALDALVRSLASLALLAALGFLLYAAGKAHTHHCPGCRYH